jgi:hypothetical protein
MQEEMESEEEKDDRPSLGILAHEVAESQFHAPSNAALISNIKAAVLKEESD